MKTRIVYPKMWNDVRFADTNVTTKLLFCYLINNERLGLSRYTRITDRQITFDTGLTSQQLTASKKELSNIGWCYFYSEWVFHNHNAAYIDYDGRDRVVSSKELEISNVPEEVKEVFKGLITGYKPVLNTKSKIENKTEKEIGKRENTQPGRVAAGRIISVFNQAVGKNYSLTDARYDLISRRLKTFREEQLSQAAVNIGLSPFHMGKNDRAWRADPDWLFRNDENVDKALNLEVERPQPPVKLGYKARLEAHETNG